MNGIIQSAVIFEEFDSFVVELPAPHFSVVPGVLWGDINAFPSPAFWAMRVKARRLREEGLCYKLGSSLAEEIGACLLGGHGIPAHIGIAAFQRLKAFGVFLDASITEDIVYRWLSDPFEANGTLVRYRFARQKAKYLAGALSILRTESPPLNSGEELRNWLLRLPGIGLKTASWITRNWLDADDVAILDIHILRAGLLAGFFDPTLSVQRHYLQLEEQFLNFSRGLGVRASELDAVIWFEMMSSPRTVHALLRQTASDEERRGKQNSARFAPKQPQTDSHQTTLFV